MALPLLLLKLQNRVRKAEKNQSLDILVYIKNDYESGLSTHDMEMKYAKPPIKLSMTNTAIGNWLKQYCHIELRKGPYNTNKSAK